VPSKRSEIPRPKMNPDEATARSIVKNEGVLARRASDCILCRAPGHALYARLRDEDRRAPGIWNLLACSACGLGSGGEPDPSWLLPLATRLWQPVRREPRPEGSCLGSAF